MITDTALQFYPLTIVEDPPDIIIGRVDINSYAVFPEDGANILKELEAGRAPEEAARWYQERYGETIDIADFLDTLRDLQFLREGTEEIIPIASTRSLIWQRIGRALFSVPAWIVYALLFGYSCYLLLRFPTLRPTYSNLLFSPYLVIIELGLFLGQFPGILFHEIYHVLAARRMGISSSLGIGRRLYFLVFETHLTGLWSVPRKARYLPFLAGMLGDVTWFSLLTIAASLTLSPTQSVSLFGAFCLALAISTLLRFVWQFYFYLETDLYYVFINIFRCVDLQQTTRQYIWNRIYRLLGQRDKIQNEEEWHPRDRQVARWYAFVLGAGYLFTLGTLVLVGLPTAVSIFSRMITHLLVTGDFGKEFWDACIFLSLNALQLAVVMTIFIRDYRKRKQAAWLNTIVEHKST